MTATATPLRPGQFSLRRLFLYTHIVAVSLSAALGIGQLVTGYDGDFKVLMTAFTIAIASVCGLGCGAAYESQRARVLPICGIALSLLGAAMIIFLVWVDHRGGGETFFKATAVVCVFAVACSHVSLLSTARLAPRYNWASPVAVVAIFAVASLICAPIVFDKLFRPYDALLRWIAVAAIVDAAMSVLIPVFHLLSRSELRAPDDGAMPSMQTLDDEIAALEARLTELRALRASKLP